MTTGPNQRLTYAYEACDPVEALSFPVNGIPMSDFIYPSYFEGFGLPVLEAMGCGTPVITSRGSSLEEVAQGAALLVDPLDAGSIAEALKSVLEDADLRSHLSATGLARSRQFSFKNAAKETLSVYERICEIP